jgi:hypothetical protein
MSYIGSPPASQAFAPGTDTFSGTGSQTAFTLSRNVATVNDILVIVNNVEQQPSHYSVSTSTLTFSTAPSSGTNNIYVRYLSTNLITIAPQQGSVTKQALDIGSGGVGTGSMQLPVGTTTDRPATPLAGYMRYNTTLGYPEWYDGTSWWQVNQTRTYSVDVLMVGGGGSGSKGTGSAGSGAGGYLEGSMTLTVGTAYVATIGAGGTAPTVASTIGNKGADSTFNSATALAGGVGSINNGLGLTGGSGGGAAGATINSSNRANTAATQGTSGGLTGYGFTGGTTTGSNYYAGSGGGGAGAVGVNHAGTSGSPGGAGGAGRTWLNGSTYAGGGGGAAEAVVGVSSGGTGGGGRGGDGANLPFSGTANTGGGGGGTGLASQTATNGGSGIVILRYAGDQRGTGGTITSSGGYTYHTFTTSGTYTA